jgi:hypothetical protein
LRECQLWRSATIVREAMSPSGRRDLERALGALLAIDVAQVGQSADGGRVRGHLTTRQVETCATVLMLRTPWPLTAPSVLPTPRSPHPGGPSGRPGALILRRASVRLEGRGRLPSARDPVSSSFETPAARALRMRTPWPKAASRSTHHTATGQKRSPCGRRGIRPVNDHDVQRRPASRSFNRRPARSCASSRAARIRIIF